MNRFIPIVSLFFCLTLFSCDKKEEKAAANCTLESVSQLGFQNELAAIQTAAAAYANDQSTANCNNYKDAYRNYINSIDDVLDCLRQFDLEQVWEDAIDEAEDEIATIC